NGSVARSLAACALVGVGAAFAATGHAATASPRWLMMPATFAHGIGLAFWIGALVPLGYTMTEQRADAAVTLKRFSRSIPFALVPVVVAGIALAVVQLDTVDALWTTAYGRVFLGKMVLVATLLGIAAFNRYRLTVPAAGGEATAQVALGRSIR